MADNNENVSQKPKSAADRLREKAAASKQAEQRDRDIKEQAKQTAESVFTAIRDEFTQLTSDYYHDAHFKTAFDEKYGAKIDNNKALLNMLFAVAVESVKDQSKKGSLQYAAVNALSKKNNIPQEKPKTEELAALYEHIGPLEGNRCTHEQLVRDCVQIFKGKGDIAQGVRFDAAPEQSTNPAAQTPQDAFNFAEDDLPVIRTRSSRKSNKPEKSSTSSKMLAANIGIGLTTLGVGGALLWNNAAKNGPVQPERDPQANVRPVEDDDRPRPRTPEPPVAPDAPQPVGNHFGVCFAKKVDDLSEACKPFRNVFLEPGHYSAEEIKDAQSKLPNTQFHWYTSSARVGEWEKDLCERVRSAPELHNGDYEGGTIMNVGKPGWKEIILEKVGKIAEKGGTGVYWDNIDDIIDQQDKQGKTGAKDAMVGLIKEIRTKYPAIKTITFNRGLDGIGSLKTDFLERVASIPGIQFNIIAESITPEQADALSGLIKKHPNVNAFPIGYEGISKPDEYRKMVAGRTGFAEPLITADQALSALVPPAVVVANNDMPKREPANTEPSQASLPPDPVPNMPIEPKDQKPNDKAPQKNNKQADDELPAHHLAKLNQKDLDKFGRTFISPDTVGYAAELVDGKEQYVYPVYDPKKPEDNGGVLLRVNKGKYQFIILDTNTHLTLSAVGSQIFASTVDKDGNSRRLCFKMPGGSVIDSLAAKDMHVLGIHYDPTRHLVEGRYSPDKEMKFPYEGVDKNTPENEIERSTITIVGAPETPVMRHIDRNIAVRFKLPFLPDNGGSVLEAMRTNHTMFKLGIPGEGVRITVPQRYHHLQDEPGRAEWHVRLDGVVGPSALPITKERVDHNSPNRDGFSGETVIGLTVPAPVVTQGGVTGLHKIDVMINHEDLVGRSRYYETEDPVDSPKKGKKPSKKASHFMPGDNPELNTMSETELKNNSIKFYFDLDKDKVLTSVLSPNGNPGSYQQYALEGITYLKSHLPQNVNPTTFDRVIKEISGTTPLAWPINKQTSLADFPSNNWRAMPHGMDVYRVKAANNEQLALRLNELLNSINANFKIQPPQFDQGPQKNKPNKKAGNGKKQTLLQREEKSLQVVDAELNNSGLSGHLQNAIKLAVTEVIAEGKLTEPGSAMFKLMGICAEHNIQCSQPAIEVCSNIQQKLMGPSHLRNLDLNRDNKGWERS